jgi:hypothetical protein
MIQRSVRPAAVPRLSFRPAPHARPGRGGFVGPAAHSSGKPAPTPHFAHRSVGDQHAPVFRRHHRTVLSGWIYPYTLDTDASYVGAPYGPLEAVPVFAPPAPVDPSERPAASASRPRALVTNVRDENADACRAERVTVPAQEGEREITVVRC